jgi:hypothetical protein
VRTYWPTAASSDCNNNRLNRVSRKASPGVFHPIFPTSSISTAAIGFISPPYPNRLPTNSGPRPGQPDESGRPTSCLNRRGYEPAVAWFQAGYRRRGAALEGRNPRERQSAAWRLRKEGELQISGFSFAMPNMVPSASQILSPYDFFAEPYIIERNFERAVMNSINNWVLSVAPSNIFLDSVCGGSQKKPIGLPKVNQS